MKIELPKDWSQVTLKQFQAIQALLKDEEVDVYQKNTEIISVLSGMDLADVEKLSLKSYANIMKVLDFISEPMENKLTRKFTLNGKKYRILTDVYKLNGGQYITLQHLLGNPDKVMDNLHHIMAVFAIPYERKWYGWKRGKYDAKKHEEVAQEMLDCPISIVQPLSSFFFTSWQRYAERMLAYSERETRKLERKLVKELKRINPDTDGYRSSIPYLITMLQNGAISSIWNYVSSSISSASKEPNKHTTTSS